MAELPMRDVDADDPQVRRLRAAGWRHAGNDLWVKTPGHPPLRRDSAMKIEEAFALEQDLKHHVKMQLEAESRLDSLVHQIDAYIDAMKGEITAAGIREIIHEP